MNVEIFNNKLLKLIDNERFYNKFLLNLLNSKSFHLQKLLYMSLLRNTIVYIIKFLADDTEDRDEEIVYLKSVYKHSDVNTFQDIKYLVMISIQDVYILENDDELLFFYRFNNLMNFITPIKVNKNRCEIM